MQRTKCRSYRIVTPFKGTAWLFLASQLLLVRTGAVFTPPRNLVDLMSSDPQLIPKLTTTLIKSLRGDVPLDIKHDAIQDIYLHLLTPAASGLTPLETFTLQRAHNHPRVLWFAHLTQIFKSRISNFLNKTLPIKMSGSLSIQTTSDLVSDPGSKILPESNIPASSLNGEDQYLLSERLNLGRQRVLRFKSFVVNNFPHPSIVSAMDLFIQDHDIQEARQVLDLDDSDFKDLHKRLKDLLTVFIYDEYTSSLA